jgi:hypothetical protein
MGAETAVAADRENPPGVVNGGEPDAAEQVAERRARSALRRLSQLISCWSEDDRDGFADARRQLMRESEARQAAGEEQHAELLFGVAWLMCTIDAAQNPSTVTTVTIPDRRPPNSGAPTREGR